MLQEVTETKRKKDGGKKTKNKEEIVERKREGKKRSKTKLAEKKKNFSKASAIRTIQNHLHCNYVSVIISARVTNK